VLEVSIALVKLHGDRRVDADFIDSRKRLWCLTWDLPIRSPRACAVGSLLSGDERIQKMGVDGEPRNDVSGREGLAVVVDGAQRPTIPRSWFQYPRISLCVLGLS
jgi:hypothetical protein